ncbi:hypothetical protein [Streptomyces sp. NPDC054797]
MQRDASTGRPRGICTGHQPPGPPTRGPPFDYATFAGGYATFRDVEFTGGTVSFRGTSFTGGTVNLQGVGSWTAPPIFDDGVVAHPPTGLLLPESAES